MRTLQDLINKFEPIILEAVSSRGQQYTLSQEDIDGIIESMDRIVDKIMREANKEINELMARLERGILARRPTWGEIWGDFKQGWNNWLSGNYPGGKNYSPEMPTESLELHTLMRKFETLYERDMSQKGVLDRPQRTPDPGMNIFTGGSRRPSPLQRLMFNVPSQRGKSPNLDSFERDTRGNSDVQPLLKWFRKSMEIIFRKHIHASLKSHVINVLTKNPQSGPGPDRDLDAANRELQSIKRRGEEPEPEPEPAPETPKTPEVPPPPVKVTPPETPPETPPPVVEPKVVSPKKKRKPRKPRKPRTRKPKSTKPSEEEIEAKRQELLAKGIGGPSDPLLPLSTPKAKTADKTEPEEDLSDLFGDMDDDVTSRPGAFDWDSKDEPEEKAEPEEEHPIKAFVKKNQEKAGISDEEIAAVKNWDDEDETMPLLSRLPDD